MSHGENALIDWLRHRFTADPRRVPIGIGDDAAAVRFAGGLVVITADMLLDGVHFDLANHAPEQIGRKAIACSLSDCAAMACMPVAATVSIALPKTMPFERVQRLADGMAGIAQAFGCDIVGGDTTSWTGGLVIDVAMLAEPMTPRGPIRRSTAQPGDTLYVSGPLGGSLGGKHLAFLPQLELANRLVREPDLHAMMDISDGLALDLHRLCTASGCDAELSDELLESAISEAAYQAAEGDDRSPLDHALSDGEDFELLIAGGADLTDTALGLIPIGQILPRTGPATVLYLSDATGQREPLEPKGYEHFR